MNVDLDSWSGDVIVVGAGNAGLVAALEAHQQGARVIVLEAAPEAERGGNSHFTGAYFRFAHHGFDHVLPVIVKRDWTDRVEFGPYPPDVYFDDVMRLSGGRADPVIVRMLAEQSYDTMLWMRDQGVQWGWNVGRFFDPHARDPKDKFALQDGGPVAVVNDGGGLIADLFAAVEREGIDVAYEAPAHELIMSGSTAVGVRVRTADRFVDLHGVVVLASGGFEASPELRRRYLGDGWDLVKVRGTRFNTGRMLLSALHSGAQPAGHWGGCHATPIDANAPDVGQLGDTEFGDDGQFKARYSYPYSVMVNIEGNRFLDEAEDFHRYTYAKTGAAIRAQPQSTAVQVFDQKAVPYLEPRYRTARRIEADTLGELAKKAGIDVDRFEHTIAEYNQATQEGTFDPYRKDGLATSGLYPPKSNWAQPLDTPPYVAVRVTCGITFTYGGVRCDDNARVLDTEGKAMPGLYATGEISGLFFHNYPAGTGLMRGALFGRIGGRNAAAEAKQRQGAGA